jgi:hypothetical protein
MADEGMVALRDVLGKILASGDPAVCVRVWRWFCGR